MTNKSDVSVLRAVIASQTTIPSSRGAMLHLGDLLRAVDKAERATIQPAEAVHLVQHATANTCHEWTEVKADRFQKFVDAGFVTRTLYTAPAAIPPAEDVLTLVAGYNAKTGSQISQADVEFILSITAPVAIQPAGDAVYAVIYDDAEMRPVIVMGERAARGTYARIGAKGYNAHLFVKLESNSRDDPYYDMNAAPVASAPAQADMTEAEARAALQAMPIEQVIAMTKGAPAQLDGDAERAEFEAWARPWYILDRDADDRYTFQGAFIAWFAWQARSALATQQGDKHE